MLLDRLADSLPRWLAAPMSVLTALAEFAGAGCFAAAAAYGEYSWVYWGLGAFTLAGAIWQITDRIAARR